MKASSRFRLLYVKLRLNKWRIKRIPFYIYLKVSNFFQRIFLKVIILYEGVKIK